MASTVSLFIIASIYGYFVGRHVHTTSRSRFILVSTASVMLVAAVAYLVLADLTALQWFTAITLMITSFAAGVAVSSGLALWRHYSTLELPAHVNRTNLAVALGAGAAVALSLASTQLFFTLVQNDEREAQDILQREAEEAQEALQQTEVEARREEADRQRKLGLYEDYRLRIALTPDLTGFSPPLDPTSTYEDLLDMSDFSLRGKILALANLDDVTLRGADLAMTDLTGVRMYDTDLRRSEERRTDLRAATLNDAILHRTLLQNANLVEADLRGAYVHGTHFEGADLRWADLRGLRCGEDTNDTRDCTEEDLLALGLPSRAKRPANACWPGDEPIGLRDDCGLLACRLQDNCENGRQ